MRFRTPVAFTFAAGAALGCGSDRVAGPSDESSRAATALERAAAENGLGTDAGAAMTVQNVAAALRGGAPLRQVLISVDGREPEKWYAFGHEIRFEPATGSGPADLFGERTFRVLLAWKPTETGAHVIHLASYDDDGPIGPIFPTDLGPISEPEFELPSNLFYSEGRSLFWDAARGHQTSSIDPSATPCPAPARDPSGPLARRTCVIASFTFSLTDVEAEPAAFLFGPGGPGPSAATGTRRLSMAPQPVDGMLLTLDFRTVGAPALLPAPRP